MINFRFIGIITQSDYEQLFRVLLGDKLWLCNTALRLSIADYIVLKPDCIRVVEINLLVFDTQ